MHAVDKEIEVMPGVRFTAWTYNQRVPGPTLRCREGERLRMTFANGSDHPHTIHFHGIHPAEMDGIPGVGAGEIPPGGRTVYEFDALPAGLHLYHCHFRPLAEHIAKGLYGAFIVDPKEGRQDADELVMVLSGFDTNFDRANEVYARTRSGRVHERTDCDEARRAGACLSRQYARVRPTMSRVAEDSEIGERRCTTTSPASKRSCSPGTNVRSFRHLAHLTAIGNQAGDPGKRLDA